MEDETEDNDVVRRGNAVRRKTWRKKKKSKKENDDKEGDKMQKKDNKDEETEEEEEKNWDYFIHNSSLFIGHLLYQTMDSFPSSNSFGIFLLTIYTNNI